ncbi:RNA-directed DNA polymerase [Cellulophaga baltica]|uniref:RNA-directed DNA polymerase n=1 Tax=Cellulophaga baltica TaxID=76594 RepID=UPI0037C7C1DA
MNKYSDYTNEISSSEIYDRLIGCGMFAEKIPDFISSSEFLNYTKTLTLPITNVKDKDYVRYSSMRNINVPRQMAIPEPFAYCNLCNCISTNWNKIQKHFEFETRNQEYKVSRIHLRKMDNNCSLFEMNYKNYFKDGSPEQDIVIKSKYVVSADISNFFPSIYSHSIAWALKGKSVSKRLRNSSLWFNNLDFYSRNLKYGETNGLLIGPHASNLISEIILAKVDKVLIDKGYKYVRYIDDFTCYVESYEKAEQFLIDLSEELKKYELKLNDKKSDITPLPQASVKGWVNKINNFTFINTYDFNGQESLRTKELKSFLDFVIQLFLDEQKDSSVLNYAIKIIAKKHIGRNAKSYFIKQIHHLVLLYPYLIHLLDEFVFTPHKISKDSIKLIAEDVYSYGIKKRFFESNSYALFWALKYDFKIDSISTNLVLDSEKSEDSIFLLLAYLFDKKQGVNLVKYRKIARNLKPDFDRYWLFIYEVLSWTELSNEYRAMKKNSNVSFIKSSYR